MSADITLVFKAATYQHDVVGHLYICSDLDPWVIWEGLTKNLIDNVTGRVAEGGGGVRIPVERRRESQRALSHPHLHRPLFWWTRSTPWRFRRIQSPVYETWPLRVVDERTLIVCNFKILILTNSLGKFLATSSENLFNMYKKIVKSRQVTRLK